MACIFVKLRFLVAFMPCFGGFYFLNLFLSCKEDIAIFSSSSVEANGTRVLVEKLLLNS